MKTAMIVCVALACTGLGVFLQAGQKADPDKPVAPVAAEAPVKPPKADEVIWGKEIDGLQIGLTGVAPTYRHGERAKMEVKLRNVGKADAKVTYSLLEESAPQVTADARMTVAMPPPKDYLPVPVQRVVKPGETITLYKPELAVESTEMLRLKGLIRVDTTTTYLAPGTYKVVYGGMIQSHPKLTTGMVEFEVKDAKPFTAWGKEIGGLQAGLSIIDTRAYRPGETVTLAVRVRNVGKEAVKFKCIRQYLDENPPAVTGADGKPISQAKVDVMGVAHIPVEVNLGPGKEVVLETRIHGTSGQPYELRPGREGTPAGRDHPLYVGTGKVSLQYERVFGNSSIGSLEYDPAFAELATGKLELEVLPAPTAVTIKSVTLTDVDEDGGTISVSFGRKDSPTKLLNVPLAVGVRLVASHVMPGLTNHIAFEWENLRRLKGKVVSIRITTSATGMSVVSVASGND